MFAGQLTSCTTIHTKISYSLPHECLQVNLQPTPPDTLWLATASRIKVRRLAYCLHHQTRRLATASHIKVRRVTNLLYRQTH
jgi:hypothetical protein